MFFFFILSLSLFIVLVNGFYYTHQSMSEMMGCITARMLSNRSSQSVRQTADKSPYLRNLFGEKKNGGKYVGFDGLDNVPVVVMLPHTFAY